MRLMIVESPTKARKIASILGGEWTVKASIGHIVDLPAHALGIEPGTYRLTYELNERSTALVDMLKLLARNADDVFLATDPDREGEAIAFHLRENLAMNVCHRITLRAITEPALRAALSAPRAIDLNLVHAQEARRALDRLIGFKVSPALSASVGKSLSAGRCQSPALRLVVERQREIAAFVPIRRFGANVTFVNGAWMAEWDSTAHVIGAYPNDGALVLDEAVASRAASCRDFSVLSVDQKEHRVEPPAPFTTSTLLQTGVAKLSWSAAKVQAIAQRLFENGHITYHRTDSPNLSEDAVAVIRSYALSAGLRLGSSKRRWKATDGAQLAHEAIRPTDIAIHIAGSDDPERALYRMIRERTLSSQLEEFRYRVVTLRIASDHEGERFEYDAKGRETMEVGWRGVSPDTDPDDDANGDDAVAEHSVPLLKIGAKLVANSGAVVSHTAHPPTRYTEASLIRQLELLGIGRPSTFAAIVTHLINCGYLVSNDGALTPTDDAFAIVDTLCGRFSFVESEYTRELEDRLDQIAEGIKDYRSVVLELDRTLDQELSSMEQQAPRYPCPSCGRPLRLIDGRHGQFWGCTGYSEGCSVTCQDRDGRPGDPSAQEHQPSEKAIAYAQKLACEIQAVIPTETLASARLLGQWIEEALKGQAQRPATAKQKETIQSLVARNHLDLPSAGLDSLSMRDASVFIAHHAHNRQRSPDRRTGGASRSRNVAARPSIGTSASDTRARARAMRSRRRRRHQ